MATVPEDFRDLFRREAYGNFATVMPDGTPHVTPVWVDYDEEREQVLVNTATGRQKEKNVRANPKVGMTVLDPEDPYRYVSIRGEVGEVTTEAAVDHIDELARRYFDVEEYPNHDDEDGERVVIRIDLDRVVTSG